MNVSSALQRIIVGIDGSPGAARAAVWAAQLTARRDAELRLLHAVNLTGTMSLISRLPFDEYRQISMKRAEALLDETRADLLGRVPGLSVSTEIVAAEPVEALVNATMPTSLTVIGTRGSGGFPGLGFGSVGLRLAAHCRGPIVVVPGGDPPVPASGAARDEVVLGVAAGEPAEVVTFGFDLAAELGVALRAVHAWQPIPPYNGYYYIDSSILAATAEEVLSAALAPAHRAHSAVRASADTVCETPAAALIEAARGARVLVLGAHRHRMPLSLGIGPVLHAVLTHAPCPVLVVPLLTTPDHPR